MMKQMIFDYLCNLADDPDNPVSNDDVWYCAGFVFDNFDCTEFYAQVDRLTDEYLAKK